METSPGFSALLQKALLLCGLLAPLAYLGIDRLAGGLFQGYSFTARSMSDLGALGSPVRPLVAALTPLAAALLVAFGVGLWWAADGAWLARVVAVLLVGNALAGLVGTLFFPNRLGERPAFGSVGVLVMFSSVLCFVLAMLFAALAYPGWFRLLSIAIPAAYILLALARFATAASAPAGGASLIGAQERTMGYSFLAWVMALAFYLLRSP